MWLSLAYVHATGERRVNGSTAVLQAVCADAIVVPFLEQPPNVT